MEAAEGGGIGQMGSVVGRPGCHGRDAWWRVSKMFGLQSKVAMPNRSHAIIS